MSNPLYHKREGITARQLELSSGCPDAYIEFKDPEKWIAQKQGFRDIEVIKRELARYAMDMEVCKSFYLSKQWSVDKEVLESVKPVLASAKNGFPKLRVRTEEAKSFLNAVFVTLPEEAEVAAFTKQGCEERVLDRFYVDGGSWAGRDRLKKAYPVKYVSPPYPVKEEEARRAIIGCGLDLGDFPAELLEPYPLIPLEEEGFFSQVNPHAENGFPFGGTWSTEGAPAKVYQLATAFRERLVEAFRSPGGVWQFIRDAEESDPHLVALKCKAKGDYYSTQKIEDFGLRLYYVVGRHLVFNMQVASKVLEGLSRSILKQGHSAQGITLTRGGAHALVSKLEEQLLRQGGAFTHCGDDSLIAVKRLNRIVLFSLDCSNFDLTQHSSVTLAIHEALRDELALVDPVAADLWFAIARERRVVTFGTLVRQWKHGGASGMVLQSKVNDLLMHVLVRRIMDRIGEVEVTKRSDLEEYVQRLGRGMGLAVRLDDYSLQDATTIYGSLERQPFLYLGYYFHVIEGTVLVCADMPRSLAQMQYPSMKWEKDKTILKVREVMRLSSTVMNWGIPPRCLMRTFDVARAYLVSMLERSLAKHGDLDSSLLKWAVYGDVFGPKPEATLTGLLKAVQRDPHTLWYPQLLGEPQKEPKSWADQVQEQEERRILDLIGRPYSLPRGRRIVPPPLLRLSRPTTHPATNKNDGRPPPTAIWGPDKPPMGPRLKRIGQTKFEPEGGWRYDETQDSDSASFEGESELDYQESIETYYGAPEVENDDWEDRSGFYRRREGSSSRQEDESE